MDNVFRAAVEHLDWTAALKSAAQRNDLLPPRLEDATLGEVGKRFLESLGRSLERGEYLPDRAIQVSVPKPGFTTRPAALLTLEDRVVLEGLVSALRPRLAKYLVSENVVMWPRAGPTPKRWREFEAAPLAGATLSHVAVVDIAGFYESIEHDRLAAILLEATGQRPVVEALGELLSQCMGSARGLPQGIPASDSLSTAYLAPMDRALLRTGFNYFRHGDDIRIGVASYADAVQAITIVETEARRLGLLLNTGKTRPLRLETYKTRQDAHVVTKTGLRRRIEELKLERVTSGDRRTLEEVARSVGAPIDILDEVWDDNDELVAALAAFQAGGDIYDTFSIEEAIDVLRPVLTADDEELAVSLFREAMKSHPALNGGWPKDRFHAALTDSLTALAALRNPEGIGRAAELLRLYPDETETVAQYMAALGSKEPSKVVDELEMVLVASSLRHPWQLAWIYRVLSEFPTLLSDAAWTVVSGHAESEDSPWIQRVEAARLLAHGGRIDQGLLRRLYDRVPVQFRPDLVGCAVWAAQSGAEWAPRFVDSCRGDRVNEVVIAHVTRDG